MTHRWLHLRLAAPLMAFGGVAIDQVGPTRAFPSASALTGLIANALGLERHQTARHQDLQDRLIFAALAVDVPEARPHVLTDTQNAKLEKSDKGWTTHGTPEGRAGATYDAPHRRRRDYLSDHETRVVLRLTDGAPTTEDVTAALDRPARPLFIGRKPCLPACRLVAGWVNGDSPRAALAALALPGLAQWPDDGAHLTGTTARELPDLRTWRTGLHTGHRVVVEGRLP